MRRVLTLIRSARLLFSALLIWCLSVSFALNLKKWLARLREKIVNAVIKVARSGGKARRYPRVIAREPASLGNLCIGLLGSRWRC